MVPRTVPETAANSVARSILAVAAVTALIVSYFWETVFLGQSVSRLDVICLWDSLFQGLPAGPSVGIDEGSILFMTTYRFLVASLWRAGEIPLWNPYSGLGFPLVGEPQSFVFSPFLLPLVLAPGLYTYNLLLVFQFVLMAAGTFLLVRQLGASRSASIFSSVAITFCPYMQWYWELHGNSICLTPFLVHAFCRFALRPTLLESFYVGIMSGLLVLCGHPELSFCSVFVSCILAVLIFFIKKSSRTRTNILKTCGLFGVSGFIGVCLAAPSLFPVLEFIVQCDSYKYYVENESFLHWNTLILNMIQPVNGAASPHLGVCALLLLPFCFLWKSRTIALPVVATWIVCYFLASKLGPFSYLFQIKPFSYLLSIYFIPLFLILTSVLAGLGFDYIFVQKEKLSKGCWIAISAGLILVALVRPILLQIEFPFPICSFDNNYVAACPSRIVWYQSVLCGTILFAILIFRQRFKMVSNKVAIVLFSPVVLLSQFGIVKDALPIRPSFDFPLVEPLQNLKNDSERVIATGEHLFKSNLNQVYRIKDMRCLNAIFPQRYLDFVRKAGAETSNYKVEFGSHMNSLFNAAGVSNVITVDAIFDDKDLSTLKLVDLDNNYPLDLGRGLSIRSVSSRYLPSRRAIVLKVDFDSAIAKNSILFRSVLVDKTRDKAVYWDDFRLISDLAGKKGIYSKVFSIPVPLKVSVGSELVYGLEFIDSSGKLYYPECVAATAKLRSNRIAIDTITVAEAVEPEEPRYKLVMETQSGIRWYKNLKACADIYLGSDVVVAKDSSEALDFMSGSEFDPRTTIVLEQKELEGAGISKPAYLESFQKGGGNKIVSVNRSINRIDVIAELISPAVLLVNDMYYPGWIASLDGQEVRILHGNYAFKSILLPAGSHKVSLKYWPQSFQIGLYMFFIGAFASITAAILAFRLKRKEVQNNKLG